MMETCEITIFAFLKFLVLIAHQMKNHQKGEKMFIKKVFCCFLDLARLKHKLINNIVSRSTMRFNEERKEILNYLKFNYNYYDE